MVYRNGIKEYTLTTVLYGIPMGLLFGLMGKSFSVGIITGVLSGLLFTLFIFLFVKFQEAKFNKKREEIKQERKVICDGAATLKGNGGWLFLTESGLEFYPHKINFSTEEFKIPMNQIESVNTHKNQIVITAMDKSTTAIIVSHNKEWKKQIDQALSICK